MSNCLCGCQGELICKFAIVFAIVLSVCMFVCMHACMYVCVCVCVCFVCLRRHFTPLILTDPVGIRGGGS